MNGMFTIEEMTIIDMCCGGKSYKSGLLVGLYVALLQVTDPALRATIEEIIRKVKLMTDAAISGLDLQDVLPEPEET